MATVFVSHASEDLALAREVHQWLIDAGHEVFWPKTCATASLSARSGSSGYTTSCDGPTRCSA